ncbi:carbamoyl-phosphate synthase domain-containing protein, partial [Lactobacillus nasalidis]
MKRYLILEDGSSYAGDGIGAMTTATGELAIQTSNYGYQ